MEISPDELRRKAAAHAVKLLESRSRSKKEIESRLRQFGYSAEIIDSVMAQLSRADLVDDKAFSAEWVESRSKAREPVGRVRLRHELIQKGVDRPLIDAALDKLETGDEAAAALEAAKKRQRPCRDAQERLAERQRLAAYLQRRGFSWQITGEVLRKLFPREEEDEFGYPSDISGE